MIGVARPIDPRRLARVAFIAAFAAFLSLPPCRAQGCDLLVLKSADLLPYEEAIRGLRDASSCAVREWKFSPGDDVPDRIARQRPDAVVAVGTGAFKQSSSIRDRPVIHLMVMPAEAAKILQPNVSGVSMDAAPEAYLAALSEVFPRARRIGIVHDPRFTGPYVAEAERAARGSAFSLVITKADSAAAVPAALEDLRGKIDALWMLPDPTVAAAGTVELLLQFSFRAAVPIMTFSRKYLEQGAVASLDVDPYDMGKQAAEVAAAAMRYGSAPARVYARKHELTINTRVAEKMGIAVGDGKAGRNGR